MILRRLSHALKHQDWVTLLVEFVLVIAGVVIALQLDNWNDRQAQRQEEQAYLEQLLVEFAVIRDTLDDHTASYERFRDAALELVAVSQRDLDVTPERLNSLYQTGLAGRIPPGAPAALRELIASGKMGLIGSRDLRTLLMRVDLKAEIVGRVFDLLRTALLEQSQDIRVHVSYDTQNYVADSVRSGQTTLGEPPRSVDVQGLREDPAAMATAKSYLEAQQNMLTVLTDYQAQVEEVIDAIETELAR